jgi:hypothetical protein
MFLERNICKLFKKAKNSLSIMELMMHFRYDEERIEEPLKKRP